MKKKTDESIRDEILYLGIKRDDIAEKFIRSSGPGGQKVNKASTCVYLKHIPTGIEVKYQKERSQAQNRYSAWKLLIEKIKAFILRKKNEEKRRIEKIKRQNRRKPEKIKLKILESKKKHSRKKKFRGRIISWEQ